MVKPRRRNSTVVLCNLTRVFPYNYSNSTVVLCNLTRVFPYNYSNSAWDVGILVLTGDRQVPESNTPHTYVHVHIL